MRTTLASPARAAAAAATQQRRELGTTRVSSAPNLATAAAANAAAHSAATQPAPQPQPQPHPTATGSPRSAAALRDADRASFLELIQAREEQQERAKRQLAEQNAALRRQLDETGAVRNSAQSQGESLVATRRALSDIVAQLAGVNTALASAQEADRTMIRGLYDYFDKRFGELDARVTAVAQTAAVMDSTSKLLREEQQTQHLTLATEIEAARAATESVAAQLLTRDTVIGGMAGSIATLDSALRALDERFALVEKLPATFRDESTKMEARLETIGNSIAAERAAVTREREGQVRSQDDQFRAVLDTAQEELSRLQGSVAEAVAGLSDTRQRIAEAVEESMNVLGSRLEGDLAARIEDQSDRIGHVQSRQAAEHHIMEQAMMQTAQELRSQVDAALHTLRAQYDTAVQAQLDSIVATADQHEANRRAAFPAAEPERVELMVLELQSAFVMLEGIAKKTLGAQTTTAGTEDLERRLRLIEARVESIIAEAPAAPRVQITVGLQAGLDADAVGGGGGGGRGRFAGATSSFASPPLSGARDIRSASVASPAAAAADGFDVDTLRMIAPDEERASTDRNWLLALDHAETQHGRAAVRQETAAAEARFAGVDALLAARGESAALRTASPLPASVGVRGDSHAGQRGSLPFPAGAVGPAEAAAIVAALRSVRAVRSEKEAELQSLQANLAKIQSTFHELTQQETRSASAAAPGGQNRSGPSSGSETRRLAELIAKQKEAVFQHERQIVEQRNALWRDVAHLSEREQQLTALAAAAGASVGAAPSFHH